MRHVQLRPGQYGLFRNDGGQRPVHAGIASKPTGRWANSRLQQIARLIYPESRALVEAHLARGTPWAIISSATPYQVEPAAADLDIEHALCTHLPRRGVHRLGGEPTCFGQGQGRCRRETGGRHRRRPTAAGYPTARTTCCCWNGWAGPRILNPSSRLETIAHDRRWLVARFGSRGRPTLNQFLRWWRQISSPVTSFIAGLPIYAPDRLQTRITELFLSPCSPIPPAPNRHEAQRDRRGESVGATPGGIHLQPQSKADASSSRRQLLRWIIAGVGKQEISRNTHPRQGGWRSAGGIRRQANAGSAIRPTRRWWTPCATRALRGVGTGGHPHRVPENGALRKAPSTWRYRPVFHRAHRDSQRRRRGPRRPYSGGHRGYQVLPRLTLKPERERRGTSTCVGATCSPGPWDSWSSQRQKQKAKAKAKAKQSKSKQRRRQKPGQNQSKINPPKPMCKARGSKQADPSETANNNTRTRPEWILENNAGTRPLV